MSDVAHGGWCVAREPGGRVVFVRHALPGERVRARITDTTAKFARAEAVEILQASPDRIEPPCPHARPDGCGGCDWQHATPQAQRQLKAEVIRQQLRRIAGLDREITVEPLPGDSGGLGWRTRIRLSVGPGGAAGLLKHRSHEVVEVGACPLAHPLVPVSGITGQRWRQVSSLEVTVSPGSGERAAIVTPAAAGAAPGAGPAAAEPGPSRPRRPRRHDAGRPGRHRPGQRPWRQAHRAARAGLPAPARRRPDLAGRIRHVLAGPPGRRGHTDGRGPGGAAPGRRGRGARPVLRGRPVRRRAGRGGGAGRSGDRHRERPWRRPRRPAQPAPPAVGAHPSR